jgi:hypothetical protein
MTPETEPLDVLTIGETIVDLISVEKADRLRVERHLERMIDREGLHAGLPSSGTRAV